MLFDHLLDFQCIIYTRFCGEHKILSSCKEGKESLDIILKLALKDSVEDIGYSSEYPGQN